MGRRSRSKPLPPPPAVVEPPKPPEMIDVVNQENYMRQTMDDQFTMQDTMITSPKRKKKPNQGSTMMSSY